MNQFFTTLPKSNVLQRVFRELLMQCPSLPLFLQRAHINHFLKVLLCLSMGYTWADSYMDFQVNHTQCTDLKRTLHNSPRPLLNPNSVPFPFSREGYS